MKSRSALPARRIALPFIACIATACAAGMPPATLETVPGSLPNDVLWARTAAEHRALFVQTYYTAGERVRDLARGRAAGSWAVVLDADETVLDNSIYQRRLAERGDRYDPDTFNAWIREGAADSLPGAAAFIATVRSLGGRAIIITNRDEVVCGETRANLAQLGITVDAVFCQAPDDRGKEARFRAVADGTSPAGLPPLAIIAVVGDNIQDFPGMTQSERASAAAFARFGRDWFVVPNPMYGSWERNTPR